MPADIDTPMKPCVIHLEQQGVYEFVTADKPVIHRDCGAYTLLLDMDSGEAIGVRWPDALTAALSAPGDEEVEGLIAFIGDCVHFVEIAAEEGYRFEASDGRWLDAEEIVYQQCADPDEYKEGAIASATTAVLRSLTARLAEAERDGPGVDPDTGAPITWKEAYKRKLSAFAELKLARDAALARAEKAERARDEALEHKQALIDASGQECACGYDRPDDVCLGHLPMVLAIKAERDTALARAEQAEAERDRLEAGRQNMLDELLQMRENLRDAEAERDRLAGLVREAGEALKPFAAEGVIRGEAAPEWAVKILVPFRALRACHDLSARLHEGGADHG